MCLVSKFDILHHKRKIYYLLQIINSTAAPYKVRILRIFFFEKCNAELFWEYNLRTLISFVVYIYIKYVQIFRFILIILVLDKMLIVFVGSSHFQPSQLCEIYAHQKEIFFIQFRI